MPTDATISSASVKGLLYAVSQCGADAGALSQAVGLDSTQLEDPDGRVPMATMQRLWGLAVEATGDPHLDLHMAQHVHHSSYGVLAYVLMHSPTLGVAIQKLCRYQDIVCSGTRISLRHLGDSVELVVDLISPAIVYPHFVLNSELSIYLHMLRLLSGQSLAPEALYLAYPAPADTREHVRVFAPAQVQFGTSYSALRLPATVLALPIPTADPRLLALLEPHAAALLDRLHELPALADRVRHELLRLLVQSEPTLEAVAEALSLSPRILQRQLHQDGYSYQQLLDEVRRELAERHLRDHILSIKDIALLLGFAEPSVFIRAFRRWTGQTPGTFRRTAK
ncbi:AraC family transcriptional regulator [Spirosoma fluviale]|uniref:Transcriptional regulator, AraC family n=1 Tax=Spirosoma fluviale TaxID=1597977 RepID=A0A286G4R2_9BACT|nr:AraC family transcriptional regulator [Spirosoma fluviale]SOD90540.1 transcriptional regulator, AraC family [Spirosoma fluviale]